MQLPANSNTANTNDLRITMKAYMEFSEIGRIGASHDNKVLGMNRRSVPYLKKIVIAVPLYQGIVIQ